MNKIVSHPSPVMPRDSLVVADLTRHGLPGHYEQFWTQRVSDTVYEISCIPFFTYGISLGDRVEVNTGCVIQRVTERSGHKNLRAMIANVQHDATVHEKLATWVQSMALLYECHGPGYFAVDLPVDYDPGPAIRRLREQIPTEMVAIEIDDGSLPVVVADTFPQGLTF
jgi:hypothetical protein